MSKKDTITNPSGFTLVELMITLLIAGVIISAIYSAYSTQNRVFTAQEAVAEMQQNIRTGLAVMNRDIRMAGFDMTAKANAGFVDGVNFSNGTGVDEPVNSNATQIAFTFDLDRNGSIDQVPEDINGDLNKDMTEMEQVSYRLNGTDLQRYTTTIPGLDPITGNPIEWQTIAEQIEKIEFNYLDSDGNSTAILNDIRTVQISLLAKANRPDPKFNNTMTYTTGSGATWPVNDKFRRRFLVNSIRCRNLGL